MIDFMEYSRKSKIIFIKIIIRNYLGRFFDNDRIVASCKTEKEANDFIKNACRNEKFKQRWYCEGKTCHINCVYFTSLYTARSYLSHGQCNTVPTAFDSISDFTYLYKTVNVINQTHNRVSFLYGPTFKRVY